MVQYRAMDSLSLSAQTQNAAAAAREWIESARERWRVQILARRTRVTKDGVKTMPSRLRRFVEGLPWPYVKPAIDYLLSTAPYTGIVANGVDFGTPYRPTLTVWQRDAQQTATGAKGANVGDATYTLVQDLIEADSRDVYTVGTSSSCSETVVSDYVWDASDVEELPQGSMGVTYQIAGVHRNDDGTFDYAVVKRTALTQHSGPTVTEDNAVRRVSVETWDNVYVDADGRFCDDSWTPIPGLVSGVSAGADGSRTETKVAVGGENPDCTLRITATVETSKPAEVRRLTSENQFQDLEETERAGQVEPLGDAPDASGGTVMRHESRLRPDGSYDTTVHRETEQEVVEALVEVSKGRRGVKRVVRSDNQADPGSTQVRAFGQSVRVEKTPGRRYTNTVTTFDADVSARVGESCRRDLYKHDHTEVRGAKSVDIGHVAEASDGVVSSAETNMDDDGAILKTVRTETELEVSGSNVVYRTGRTGVTSVVKDTATAASIPSAPIYNLADVGQVTEYERTPGRRVTVTRTTHRRPQSDTAVSVTCSSDALVHKTQTDEALASAPGLTESQVHTTPGDGVSTQTTIRVDDQGGFMRETVTTQEQDVVAEKTFERKPRGTVTTVVYNSTSRDAAMPEKVGISSATLTPGNRYRLMERTVTTDSVLDSAFCERDVFLHTHDAVSYGTEVFDDDTDSPGEGRYSSREATMDSDGIVKTVVRTHTEVPVSVSSFNREEGALQSTDTVGRRSQPRPQDPDSADGYVKKVQGEMTRGGLWNTVETVVTAHRKTWETDIDTDLVKAHSWHFRNVDSYDGFCTAAANYIRRLGAPLTGTAPTSVHISASPTINEFGLYDGNVSAQASWDPSTGGATNDRYGDLKVIADFEYSIVSVSYNLGYSFSRDTSAQVTSVHTSRSVKTLKETFGVGLGGAKQAFSGVLIEGSHLTVSPTTGAVHMVVVTDASTTVSVEKINGRNPSTTKDWKVA